LEQNEPAPNKRRRPTASKLMWNKKELGKSKGIGRISRSQSYEYFLSPSSFDSFLLPARSLSAYAERSRG
jgi:hypothetical protein